MLIEDILAAHESMKAERLLYENAWDDLIKLFMPFRGDVTTKMTPGSRKINSVLDSVGMESADMLVNFVFGNIFPDKWLSIYFRNKDGDIDQDRQEIADRTSSRILDALDSSNFYSEFIDYLRDMIVLGTGVLRMRKDMVFDAVHIPECHIMENEKKQIDVVFWEFELTKRQARERYGKNLPIGIMESIMKGDLASKVKFIQAVFPRTDSIPWSKSPEIETAMPYASVVVCCEGNKIVKQDGFKRNPYIVGRWMKARGETWGYGVGHKVRPDMKGGNEIMRQILLGIPMSVRNPLAVPHEGVLNREVLPGAVMTLRPGPWQPFFVTPGNDYEAAQAVRLEGHKVIRSAFLVDLLQEPDTEPRSAAESVRRQRMALQKLSGPARRIHDEALSPASRLIFNTMLDAGELPEIKEMLNGGEDLDVVIGFNSPLLTAQREAALSGLDQTISEAAALAANLQDPRWLDSIDPDGWHELKRGARSLPGKAYLKSDEVTAVRNARADKSARAEMAALAESAAKVSKATQ